MKKRRVGFYWHLKRMDQKSQIKKISNYFDQSCTTQLNWLKVKVKADVRKIEENIETEIFYNLIIKIKEFREKVKTY